VSSESAGLSVVDATERIVRETSRAVSDHCRLAERPGCVTSSIGIMPDQSIVPPRNGEENPGLLRRRLIFGDPERSIVRLSWVGERIAFRAPVDGILNLWVRLSTGSACLTQYAPP
jgi:hypothetical protein